MNQTNQAPSVPVPANPFEPAQPAAKRSRLFYAGLAGVIAGGICCLLSVVLLILYFILRPKALPLSVSLAQNPAGTTLPPITSNMPASTGVPVSTATPPPPLTATAATSFSDDFSSPNSGWRVDASTDADCSYNPLGFYEMGVKQVNRRGYGWEKLFSAG